MSSGVLSAGRVVVRFGRAERGSPVVSRVPSLEGVPLACRGLAGRAGGFAALVASVLNGKGAMPAKGGNAALEQADIENAVRYMLEQAGVSAAGS